MSNPSTGQHHFSEARSEVFARVLFPADDSLSNFEIRNCSCHTSNRKILAGYSIALRISRSAGSGDPSASEGVTNFSAFLPYQPERIRVLTDSFIVVSFELYVSCKFILELGNNRRKHRMTRVAESVAGVLTASDLPRTFEVFRLF